MEEDIKILEEMLSSKDPVCNYKLKHQEIEAISNLLTRYKQLEENTQLKTITQEYNSYLQDSNCDTKIIIADSEYFANGYFKENFIPKSKVIEKIKELEDGTYDAKIILQQLLEENTGNHIPRID